MTNEAIRSAITAAAEFQRRAKVVLIDLGKGRGGYDISASPRDTGALRRQSLELTRALADMRKV